MLKHNSRLAAALSGTGGYQPAKRLAALLAILTAFGAPGGLSPFVAASASAAEPELVLYDSIDTAQDGRTVLTGGAYEDAEQGERLSRLEKNLGAAPHDGYYHIRFVADADAMARAVEFTDMFLNHEAFASIRNRFRIEYVTADADRMNCGNNVAGSSRVLTCNMSYILSLGKSPVHMTAVFTSRGSGGCGGMGKGVPIASVDYPLPTMLHEMLHIWTLNDEYTYSQSEADLYCSEPQMLKGPNTTTFNTLKTYSSDAEARVRHQKDIPWIDYIPTPITGPGDAGFGEANGANIGIGLRLGTPMSFAGKEAGLYSGANCSRKRPSFRPYGIDTIMKTLSTTWLPPIHQKAVLAVIAKAAGW